MVPPTNLLTYLTCGKAWCRLVRLLNMAREHVEIVLHLSKHIRGLEELQQIIGS
jgi:hypothetical protein